MKKRVLPWLAMGSSLAVIGAIVFMPTPVAKAQTDPGQNPEPTPHAEATATPTPCPQATTETNWIAHAKLLGWKCVGSTLTADTTGGSYELKTIDPCNGNSSKSHTTSWEICDMQIVDVEYGEAPDTFTLKEPEYKFHEISDDGTVFFTTDWKRPDKCCVND